MVEYRPADLNLIFGALADPTRRAILRSLARRERSVGELAEPFHVSLNAVSKHLKVLERADLVRRRREGTVYWIRHNPAALKHADRWLSFYTRFWNSRLQSLDEFVREKE